LMHGVVVAQAILCSAVGVVVRNIVERTQLIYGIEVAQGIMRSAVEVVARNIFARKRCG
jgi:hypothetical protein